MSFARPRELYSFDARHAISSRSTEKRISVKGMTIRFALPSLSRTSNCFAFIAWLRVTCPDHVDSFDARHVTRSPQIENCISFGFITVGIDCVKKTNSNF